MMQKMSTSAAPVAVVSKMNGFENKANTNVALQAEAPASAFQSVLKSQVHTRQPKTTAEVAKQHAPQTVKQATDTTVNQVETGQKSNAKSAVKNNAAPQSLAEQEANTKAVDEMVELAAMASPVEAKPANQDETTATDLQLKSQPEGIAFFGLMPALTKALPLQNNANNVQASINTQSTRSDATTDPSLELVKLDVTASKDAPIATSTERASFFTQLNDAKVLQTQAQDISLNAASANQELETPAPLATAISGLQKSQAAPLSEGPQVITSQAATNHVAEVFSGKATWNQAISQRVLWMVGAGEQSATLTLNPPDLGPLQVVVQVHNGMADTRFTSDNAEVRQALQDGMENLREKMRESGVQLGQTNVQSGEQSRQEFQQASHQNNDASRRGSANVSTQNAPVVSQIKKHVANGLVDTFA